MVTCFIARGLSIRYCNSQQPQKFRYVPILKVTKLRLKKYSNFPKATQRVVEEVRIYP